MQLILLEMLPTDILVWYVPLSVLGHLCIYKQGYLMTGWFHIRCEAGFS